MIEVESGPVEPGSGPLPHDVVILPSCVDGDTGSYCSALVGLLGQLRADGMDAGYWHDGEHRRVRMGVDSVVLELAIGFGAAVAGGAAWEAIKAALEKATGTHTQVRVTVLRQRRGPDGVVSNDWFEFRGDPEWFITALSKVIGASKDPAELDEPDGAHSDLQPRRSLVKFIARKSRQPRDTT